MRSKWLQQGRSDRLILFCNGWGMDENPFLPLDCHDWDLLMLYDYQSLTVVENLKELLQRYEETVLISWSMGVWVGQQLFAPFRAWLSGALAINGTLRPVDDNGGIPEAVFRATLAAFNEKQRLKFYYRMCRERELYKTFLEYQPRRNLASQHRELEYLLQNVTSCSCEHSIYNSVVVADRDHIMPTKNQIHFWEDRFFRLVGGSHFIFYSYKSWDELAAEAEKNEALTGMVDGFNSE